MLATCEGAVDRGLFRSRERGCVDLFTQEGDAYVRRRIARTGSSAYIFCTITIPFQPCWTLWGHVRRCNAFSKWRRNFRMRSKLGRGSKEGMFVPTRAYTSSNVMVTSICIAAYDFVANFEAIADSSMLGRHEDIHGKGVYCCLM